MKIGLINPPSPTGNFFTGEFFPPLGLAYLASILEEGGFPVAILDMAILRMTFDSLKKELEKSDFKIVGITSMIHTHPLALKIAEAVKQVNSRSIVIIGGVPSTFSDFDILKKCKEIDIVVRGEGEYTFLELVKAIYEGDDWRTIKGITYRKRDSLIRTEDRALIKDLDLLPFPARHLLPMKEYLNCTGTITISTSRGCPFHCIFCSVPSMWGHKWRARTVKNIMKEIVKVKKDYACKYITFVDDTFTLDMARTSELCDAIMKESLDILWSCTTRADRLTRALLEKIKKAGCIKIALGVESGSQEIVEGIRKGIRLYCVKQVVNWIKSLGIKLKLNFMYGLPGETEEDLKKSFSLIQELNPDEISFNKLTLFPGTPEIFPSTFTIELDQQVNETISKLDIFISNKVGYSFLENHLPNSSKNKTSTSGIK